MTEAERKASHKRPEFLERVAVGDYRVKGTELHVVQDGKQWKITGHEPVEGERFGKRQLAADKVQALGLVPAVPAEQPVQPEPAKAEAPTVLDPGDASGADGANGGTDRRPRTRKPRKAAAKV